MNIDQKFVVFCVKQCLHLWDAPKCVTDWLDDPMNQDKAYRASTAAREMALAEKAGPGSEPWATKRSVAMTTWKVAIGRATERAEETSPNVKLITNRTTKSLDITPNELKHQFMSTLTDKELANTNPDWIDYINAEIFSR